MDGLDILESDILRHNYGLIGSSEKSVLDVIYKFYILLLRGFKLNSRYGYLHYKIFWLNQRYICLGDKKTKNINKKNIVKFRIHHISKIELFGSDICLTLIDKKKIFLEIDGTLRDKILLNLQNLLNFIKKDFINGDDNSQKKIIFTNQVDII